MMKTGSVKSKIISGVLCAAILVTSSPFAFAAEALPEKPMTMAEKVAAAQAAKDNPTTTVQLTGVQPGNLYIPKGTTFDVELVKDANSKTNKTGQAVEVRMVDNLMINGVVIIAKDTIGEATVTEARKAGGFGRKGKLTITPTKIKTINNVTVPVTASLEGSGSTDGGAVAVAVAVSLIGGLFMKGSNINYPAGTNIKVSVEKDTDLQTTPEKLSFDMNPANPHGNNLVLMVK
ncbi:MAG: hypothetical protein AB9858_05490 [Acidaminococcaceae bacterium]